MSSPLPDFNLLWNYDDPGATERTFRDVWSQAKQHDDRNYESELVTQIARTLGLQLKFAEAHALLDGVERELDLRTPRVKVRYLLERGRVFNSSGAKAEADALFVRAFDVACEHGLGALAVDAAHMVAIVRPDDSLEWNLKALEMAGQSEDPLARKWRASLCNNLGWTFVERQDYRTAHRYFEEALQCRLTMGKPTDVLVARWCVAKSLRLLGQVDSSLALQYDLDREWQQRDQPSGYVYEEIAECLLALDRSREAAPYFGKAWQLLKEDAWLSRDEADRLSRLHELSLA